MTGGWSSLRHVKPPLLTLPVINYYYYFQNLKTIGIFDETDPVCMYVMITLSALITNHYYYSDCLRFSFLHIIERELQQVATEWNHHIIRRTSAAYFPAGCPEVLYFNPDTAGYYRVYIYLVQEYFTLYRYTGTVDYLQPFDDVDLQFTMHHIPYPDPSLSLEFLEAAEILMRENNLEFPHTLKKLLLFILILMICFM